MANRGPVRVFANPHLDDAAASEVDAVVQANKDQQHQGRDVDRSRKRNEEVTLADKVQIDIGSDKL